MGKRSHKKKHLRWQGNIEAQRQADAAHKAARDKPGAKLPKRAERAHLEPLTFGKFKGTPLSDVPKDYLRWVMENLPRLSGRVRFDIECVLAGQKSQREEVSQRSEWHSVRRGEWHNGANYVPFTGDPDEVPFAYDGQEGDDLDSEFKPEFAPGPPGAIEQRLSESDIPY